MPCDFLVVENWTFEMIIQITLEMSLLFLYSLLFFRGFYCFVFVLVLIVAGSLCAMGQPQI